MRTAYPSDVSRDQFEAIRHILVAFRKTTRPRTYDIYDIFCAVLYVLREGCRWRALPHDYPKWKNVYYHFRAWSAKNKDGKSILDAVLEELVLTERVMNGRQAGPSMAILD
jgi:transposase